MTRIYEAHHYLAIQADYADPAKHRHMAAHVIVSLAGEITVVTDNGSSRCYGAMVPSGVFHQIDTNETPCLIFLFDPSSNAAEKISEFQPMAQTTCQAIAVMYKRFEQAGTKEAFLCLEKVVLSLLGLSALTCCVEDERIRKAMKQIRNAPGENVTCPNVAAALFLSQSRFSHLFRQETGMTFAAYTIYQRIMYVYKALWEGKCITKAALEAGFSSSAHFADVNRRVFGLTASVVAKDMFFQKIA